MGFYPVMPGFRFPYDVDGTVVLRTRESNVWYEWSTEHKRIALSEDFRMVSFPSIGSDKTKIAFVFPEARSITAAFIAAAWTTGTSSYHTQVGVTYPIPCEYSTDTTNGVDGEWSRTNFVDANPLASDYTPLGASFYPQLGPGEEPPYNGSGALANPVLPYYRIRAKAPEDAIIGAKGIRLWMGPNGVVPTSGGRGIRLGVQLIHLYGSYSSSTRNRLAFWRANADAPLRSVDVDLGDTQIATNYTKNFRLKNLSASKTATNVALYVENSNAYVGLSDFVDFFYSGAYSKTVILPSIAPGGFSPIITVRFRIPYNSRMSTYPARLGFSVGVWE